MENDDEASPSIILAGQALLVKMLIPLMNRVMHLVQTLYTYEFQHCQATGLLNGDEASPSIIWQIELF